MSKNQPNPARTKVLACATVIEEMRPIMPPEMDSEILDFGLHLVPNNLKQALQTAIDENSQHYDTIILGYGVCAMAVVGLKANDCTLVIPKVDDCIDMFLGSRAARAEQNKKELGTYYLTKGWIEVSDTLLDDYHRSVEKYGEEKAIMIMDIMLKHYKRLVYIDTGVENQADYRVYAQKVADQFDLHFEEIRGDNTLIEKMVNGPWQDDFVVLPPGETIKFDDFNQS